eukprot:751786-Hanusia_phi.AAC.2
MRTKGTTETSARKEPGLEVEEEEEEKEEGRKGEVCEEEEYRNGELELPEHHRARAEVLRCFDLLPQLVWHLLSCLVMHRQLVNGGLVVAPALFSAILLLLLLLLPPFSLTPSLPPCPLTNFP